MVTELLLMFWHQTEPPETPEPSRRGAVGSLVPTALTSATRADPEHCQAALHWWAMGSGLRTLVLIDWVFWLTDFFFFSLKKLYIFFSFGYFSPKGNGKGMGSENQRLWLQLNYLLPVWSLFRFTVKLSAGDAIDPLLSWYMGTHWYNQQITRNQSVVIIFYEVHRIFH